MTNELIQDAEGSETIEKTASEQPETTTTETEAVTTEPTAEAAPAETEAAPEAVDAVEASAAHVLEQLPRQLDARSGVGGPQTHV